MKNGIRTYTCIGCGKSVTKSCTKTVKFCSAKCYHAYGKTGRPKTGTDVICVACEKSFYKPASQIKEKNFCSPDCHNKYQSRNKVTLTCKICGNFYSVSKSFLNHGNRTYCSIQCRDDDPGKLAQLKEMNQKQQQGKQTRIEKTGYALLDSLGIKYIAQHLLFEKFCVDAFLPQQGVVIQFDGDYWHGNTEKFPKLDKRQMRRKNLDTSQDAYMKKAGIKVIRIWGSDIESNPHMVANFIMQSL